MRQPSPNTLDLSDGVTSISDFLRLAMLATCEALMASRAPDVVIGPADDPDVPRWHLSPKGDQPNAYVHRFFRDDSDRALHDHRMDNVSVILAGRCCEHFHCEPLVVDGDKYRTYHRERFLGDVVSRQARTPHRISLIDGQPMTTLFFTGPAVRQWGFHLPSGWVHWKDFVDGPNDALGGGTYRGQT